ncbi:hypothetical protein KI387_008995, partial [Taxus chinensis]
LDSFIIISDSLSETIIQHVPLKELAIHVKEVGPTWRRVCWGPRQANDVVVESELERHGGVGAWKCGMGGRDVSLDEDIKEKTFSCESPLWNDSISAENGMLAPCPELELPLKPEDSVKIEELPCAGGEEDFNNISSETVNNSNTLTLGPCPEEGLIPCNVDFVEYKGLLLVHLLTTSAEASSDGAHELVDINLARLRELVSPTGFTMARVAYYLFQALHQHHCFSGSGDMEAEHHINSNGASEAIFLGVLVHFIKFILISR